LHFAFSRYTIIVSVLVRCKGVVVLSVCWSQISRRCLFLLQTQSFPAANSNLQSDLLLRSTQRHSYFFIYTGTFCYEHSALKIIRHQLAGCGALRILLKLCRLCRHFHHDASIKFPRPVIFILRLKGLVCHHGDCRCRTRSFLDPPG